MSRTLSASSAFALLVALTGPAAAGESPEAEQFNKIRGLYQDSRSAHLAKDYTKAIEHLQEMLKLMPLPTEGSLDRNLARVHYDMAGNFALLGKKKEGLESLGNAVQRGFWDAAFLMADDNMATLREEKEFAAIAERARRGLPEIAFGLKDLAGKEIRKEDHAGKVVIIDIWGTWCFPCRMEIPHFVKLQEKYGKEGLSIIGLTWERRPPDDAVRKTVTKYVADNKVNYTVALIPQGTLAAVPMMQGFPTTLYVGRDGLLADRVTGAETYEEIEKRALVLLKKEAPKPDAPAAAAAEEPAAAQGASASGTPPAARTPS